MNKKAKDNEILNSNEFEELTTENINVGEKPNLKEIYSVTYDELTSQQSKRDTVFGVFITLFTFAVPLSFANNLNLFQRSFLFLALGIIGILFSFIIVRYREYKESYWLACRTLTIMETAKRFDKKLLQSAFLYCMQKAATSFYKDRNAKDKEISLKKFIKKTLWSAETIYMLIISLISSALIGIFVGCLFFNFYSETSFGMPVSIVIGFMTALIILIILMFVYIRAIYKIYIAVDKKYEGRGKDGFNRAFGRAWTLHSYISVESVKKD